MSLTLQRRGLVDEYKGYQFRRESMAQDSQGKLIYPHNARFESGPFGDKAVMVEEGTENLAGTDNSFEQGINDFVGQASTVIENSSEEAYLGKKSLKATSGSVSSSGIRKTIYNVSGKTITLSMMVKGVDSAIGKEVHANIYDSVSGHTSGDRTILDGTWQKIYVTKLVSENAPAVYVYWLSTELPVGAVVYADCVQIEAKPYATTFTPSTRAEEDLTIPVANVLNHVEGTIEFWWKPQRPSGTVTYQTRYPALISLSSYNSNNSFILWAYGTEPPLRFFVKGASSSGWSASTTLLSYDSGWYDYQFHHYAITWSDASVFNIYRDGLLLNNNPIVISDPLESLGNGLLHSNYVVYSPNAFYSNLRLSSIARTAEQLAPLDAPPTVDEYTTLYLPFNGADNTRAAKSIVI